jgi:uncharacterized damage-inducible protein DinB
MQADQVRFLFAYDRWATKRVLNMLDGLDSAVWERSNVVAERGLGGILVHQLGATQRWRTALLTSEGRSPGELDMINYAEELASSSTSASATAGGSTS